ncbi:hypothetical protein [Legionella spiritensis]|uniref:hypothetical protein n=1 Tax=Legionella spiritensis TaxID=452 RepID=UPI0007306267|nr:hypothetical protein [Legionella spiritensis]
MKSWHWNGGLKVDVKDKPDLGLDVFLTDFLPQKPVKIFGLSEQWPAMNMWSEQFFRDRYGEIIVPVRKYTATAYEKIHMKLLNYLDYWKNIDLENKTSQDILYLAEMNLTIRFIHSDGSVILEYYGSS